ncbi:cytochrome P450 [Streptomyces sp. SID3212]|uniref:cytochrome P450 family protein n=1 Tax=unclassified Streptomyces TaxID=2593676 RepID=UPI00136D8ACE|nr:cytochrome P450 [Streptomyces sp. SID3212]MYV51526.1 cytochrome P450 [Streptomyces sp. SID3212]
MPTAGHAPKLFDSPYYQDPYSVYDWLREHDPVHRFRFPVGDVPMVFLSRYDDIKGVLSDQRFSNDGEVWGSEAFKKSGMIFGAGTLIGRILTVLDPPDHTRVRKLAMGAFTPRRAASWKEPVERIVNEALDRLAKSEHPDVMDFASRIPADVTGEILGFPLERFGEMLHAIERAFHADPTNPNQEAEVAAAFEEIVIYGRELIVEKRRNPSDDLTSVFIQARDGEDRLTEDELVSMIALMIMAGIDTTRNLIGSSVLALLDHPDQRRLLVERPELTPSAVEEFLRYDGAFCVGLFRLAKEDLEIRGVPVPAGTPVVAGLQAGNYDPEKFEDPRRLDITRTGRRHLALGHGLHNCMGAALARLETGAAVPALLNRFPDMRLAVPREEILFEENWLLRSLPSLPVTL